ncbi:hypothetical protein DFH08DRAFT_948470 [Mycena albidolilacea]|uniref:Uncharacterized protein n=1 Tax=Mycena albidolilacea TaxID=1033008 RepID=A0AAD7AR84_9AGAR|nr:hypothetical protein DFH08DRAFT_948470 [Mycena albidolilacea]
MPSPDDPPIHVNMERNTTLEKELAAEVIAFKIVNPLLSAVSVSPAVEDIQAPNLLPSDTPVLTMVTPIQQAPTVPTGMTLSSTAEVPPAPTAKGTKATPGASKTPRNLCMIDWCKKHPGGYLSDFKIYWVSIEKTSDSDQYREVSVNAAASKTKAAS